MENVNIHFLDGSLCLYQAFNSATVVGSSRPIVSGNDNKDSVTITFIAANIAAGPQDIYSA